MVSPIHNYGLLGYDVLYRVSDTASLSEILAYRLSEN
jgi:hypothetical protein